MKKIIKGNLNQEKTAKRGWFLGSFIDKGSPFKTDAFEMKWSKFKPGEHKPSLGTQKVAKTVGIFIYGQIEMIFPNENKKITLEKEGDYIFYNAGVTHTWKANKDTLLISIRWPSIPGDQKRS